MKKYIVQIIKKKNKLHFVYKYVLLPAVRQCVYHFKYMDSIQPVSERDVSRSEFHRYLLKKHYYKKKKKFWR